MKKGLFYLSLIVLLMFAFQRFIGFELPPEAQASPNEADIGFAQDMAIHHAQAVEMSEYAAIKGNPRVKLFASMIGDAQSREIGRFFGWLEVWGQPPLSKQPMKWMHTNHTNMSSSESMGMASQKEMQQLRTLSGDEFNILFLQLMIRHHEGAVLMTNAAVKKANTPLVINASKVMSFLQAEEIFHMQIALKALGAKPINFQPHKHSSH